MPDSMPPGRPFGGDGACRDWADAFAALPLATPARDGWTDVSRQLAARNPRRSPLRRHGPWAATAAVLALAIVLPRAWPDREARSPSPAPGITPDATQPAMTASTPGLLSSPQTDERDDHIQPSSRAHADRRQAMLTKPRPHAAAVSVDSRPTADSAATELPALYAQSATLEALLARSDDERMSSGPAAALAGALEARVATIDAALSQSDPDPARHLLLWRERVAALRQLTGVESSQRWLLAQGESYDGQLALVY